ncbi:hypothetical protein DW886_15280 [Enterocloster aldenensis]|uniref:RNA ligase n=1 Tax=Enterocloster aldenensis TaxID=358742 RepID=UPI000E4F31C0|nr:hypothetical protein DW886_15280 [Enterocloster aldenensis]
MSISWNPFLNLIIEVKRRYENKFRRECSYEPICEQVNHTCVNRWLNEIGDESISNMFSGITLWQYGDFITAHYVSYFRAIDGKGEFVKYDKFFSIYDGLYMECRGVTVDVKNEILVLAPFRKFMNLMECPETHIDVIKERIKKAKTIEYTEKLDGSMISASIYNDKLVLSGSSCNHPEKSIPVKNSILYIEKNNNYALMMSNYPKHTFIFEHIFPKIDSHVVIYKNEGLYLIGLRDNVTGKEYTYDEVIRIASVYSIPTTRIIQTSLTDILNCLDDKKADEAEGFVLSIDGFKVKIKYNDFAEIQKLIKGLINPNAIMRAIEDGKIDDMVSKLPKNYLEIANQYRNEIYEMINNIDFKVRLYCKSIGNMSRKEAMIWINENVPKKYMSFVKNYYLGNPISYLKEYSGHYKTYQELLELEK